MSDDRPKIQGERFDRFNALDVTDALFFLKVDRNGRMHLYADPSLGGAEGVKRMLDRIWFAAQEFEDEQREDTGT